MQVISISSVRPVRQFKSVEFYDFKHANWKLVIDKLSSCEKLFSNFDNVNLLTEE